MVGAMSADLVIADHLALPAIIGKLPGHGDFIARGVDIRARERLDQWLSEWVDLGRTRLSEGFEDAYREAPPWIFEGASVQAVLMPSADSTSACCCAL